MAGSLGAYKPTSGGGPLDWGHHHGHDKKPVPMKLFATWEVDRTPPNCIPRLCTLTLTRLVLNKPLGPDLTSVIIAVKMQSSKRTLRSNEILLPVAGQALLDTELELSFSLQYPHFLKREGNQLHIMLQRRKKYKNRTILGFKTLAVGTINMSQVLQKQMDLELELFNSESSSAKGEANNSQKIPSVNGAGKEACVGKVYMLSLSSQPVDHEDQNKGVREDGGERVEMYSDEDEDYSSQDELGGSDSEVMTEDPSYPHRHASSRPIHRKDHRRDRASGKAGHSQTARQRNIKQKFVALLKKFKVTEHGSDGIDDENLINQRIDHDSVSADCAAEIEDLFDQLEDLSDSGSNVDNISIGSTPKPSLKPFFCSSKNLLQEGSNMRPSNMSSPSYRDSNLQHSAMSERLSDESSGGGAGGGGKGHGGSDSHPDTLTDPEFSDPPLMTSSPPQSGDEHVKKEKSSGRVGGGGRLFPRELRLKRTGRGGQGGGGTGQAPDRHHASSEATPSIHRTAAGHHHHHLTTSAGVGQGDKGQSTNTGNPSGGWGLTGGGGAPDPTGSRGAPGGGGQGLMSEGERGASSSHGHSRLHPSHLGMSQDHPDGPAMQRGSNATGSASGAVPQLHPHGGAPRKVLVEQLSRIIGNAESNAASNSSNSTTNTNLPDQITLVNMCEKQAAHVAAKLEERAGHRVICTAGPADVRATLTCLVAKLQRFCNTKTTSPPSVKLVIIGGDTFVNSLLRPYVEVFSSKPPDWQSYIKFFIIPLPGSLQHGCQNTVARYIGRHDHVYSSLFLHDSWRELLEKAEPGYYEVSELVSRIEKYVSTKSGDSINLPVAEAMVTYKEKTYDDGESSQVFVPFVSDIRVGTDSFFSNGGNPSFEDDQSNLSSLIGSPPMSSSNHLMSVDKSNKLTPPTSPHISGSASNSPHQPHKHGSSSDSPGGGGSPVEAMDLQLDYWTNHDSSNPQGYSVDQESTVSKADFSSSKLQQKLALSVSSGGGGSGNKEGQAEDNNSSFTSTKCSIKSSVWSMQLQRLPSSHAILPNEAPSTFTMHYRLKEKKSKAVMRLAKRKDKDPSGEARTVEGVTRLICLSKGQTPLKVYIDGSEWSGVKFFQLSSLWQTHIKYFPVATFGEFSTD